MKSHQPFEVDVKYIIGYFILRKGDKMHQTIQLLYENCKTTKRRNHYDDEDLFI